MRLKTTLWFFILVIMITNSSALLYNTTNMTAANNIYEQGKALNSILSGLLGYGIMLIVVIITIVITIGNTNDIMAGLGAGGFIGALSATILLPLGFIGWDDYQKMILLFGLVIIVSIYLKSRSN